VTAERAAAFQRELEVSIDVVGKLRKRGIRVLPGGDYGFPYTPHGTYARDLWIFVKLLGYSTAETLVAATRLGGELMGHPGELGVVKAGALADLLLVDGDPVANIAVLQDAARLLGVMKDGVFHKDPQKGPARGRFSRSAA
jgi:imidazolonepropionase-like amidohydrolase